MNKQLLALLGIGGLLLLTLKKQAEGKPYKRTCSQLDLNIIATSWGVRGDYLWAIFGVETSFGENVVNNPGDGRGPMQILPSTKDLLIKRYPQLAGMDEETCYGAFNFASAHMKYTAAVRGWDNSDLRNVVAYNEGPNGSNTFKGEWLYRNAMNTTIIDCGVHYFNKFRDIYLAAFGEFKG